MILRYQRTVAPRFCGHAAPFALRRTAVVVFVPERIARATELRFIALRPVLTAAACRMGHALAEMGS